MILHFITDDKFADYVIKQFAAPEMQSRFILVVYGDEIKNVDLKDKVTVVKAYSSDFKLLVTTLSDYSAIVLHGLFSPWDEVLLKAVPDNVKVAWMFWGGEMYGRKNICSSFFASHTKLLSWLHIIKKKKSHAMYELPIELYQRIDYCLTDMEEEFIFAKQYTKSKMQHLWYNYYSIEETVGSLKDSRCGGRDVWLGNSSTLENNHIDAFIHLRKLLGNYLLIVPLSYGEPWLRNSLKRIGSYMFGDKFIPLIRFMPLVEYNRLMLSCDTMIQAHYRPQAQGNIITGLWLGMRVYLSEKSMTYQYFKRIGANIYSFESDYAKYGTTPITEDEFITNRQVLKEWYGSDHMLMAVKNVVDKLQ